jgi:uncharacterized protein
VLVIRDRGRAPQVRDLNIGFRVKPRLMTGQSLSAILDARRSVLHSRCVVLFALLFAALNSTLAFALDVPPLRARVNDLAGMLSPATAQTLEQRLADFERETGHQIAVLTIPSLEGDAIEDFGIRVAEAWKIGKKGFDNGAILVIAQKERKLRIEVGYGLEGVLPDAIASRIIREVIVPRFRDGDFSGGIVAGVNAILQVTKGEALPEAARRANGQRAAQRGSLTTVLMITAILALFIGMTQRRLFGGIFGGSAAGLVAALSSSTGLALALIVGAILGAVGSSLGPGSSSQWSGGSRYRRGGWGGGFFPGGFGGGGFGGSGGGFGGGGGFSGGGGGFGGGGASGGW